MAIVAAWAARADGVFKSPPFLLRFDAHKDYAREAVEYSTARRGLESLGKALLFANGLHPDDGSWVEPVVQMGWVTDVLAVGATENEWHFEVARDIDSVEHLVGAVGWNPDTQQRGDAEGISSLVDRAAQVVSSPVGSMPLWLDIDLDVLAVYEAGRLVRIRDEKALRELVSQRIDAFDGGLGDLQTVLCYALRRAELVTVAIEPSFCGGFRGVADALATFRAVFGNQPAFRCFGDGD